MAKTTDEETAQPAAKSNKKMMLIVAVVAMAIGAGGFMFLKPGSAEANPAPKEGEVVPADAIHINLADGHFLKVGIALQLIESPKKEAEPSKALDKTISLFSGKEIKVLEDSKQREELKKTLVKEVEKSYDGDVMDVYFTEFVVQ